MAGMIADYAADSGVVYPASDFEFGTFFCISEGYNKGINVFAGEGAKTCDERVSVDVVQRP
jgi:hypothetical protein